MKTKLLVHWFSHKSPVDDWKDVIGWMKRTATPFIEDTGVIYADIYGNGEYMRIECRTKEDGITWVYADESDIRHQVSSFAQLLNFLTGRRREVAA